MSDTLLVDKLNESLAWEMRALSMYSHYASYVTGIYRLHLAPHFQAEAEESLTHASAVRDAIAKLEGIAVTAAADVEIVHTSSYEVMLEEALMTEKKAAANYREILGLIDPEDEMYDVIQQIQFAEDRAVDELRRLM
ncbi:MAG: bacterioferritin [Bradymonadia bacterium]|jgi:bacterioferritin